MSNDKLINVSKAYMLHCSINGWGVLMERRGKLNYSLPVNQTEPFKSRLHISYFLQKCKKDNCLIFSILLEWIEKSQNLLY